MIRAQAFLLLGLAMPPMAHAEQTTAHHEAGRSVFINAIRSEYSWFSKKGLTLLEASVKARVDAQATFLKRWLHLGRQSAEPWLLNFEVMDIPSRSRFDVHCVGHTKYEGADLMAPPDQRHKYSVQLKSCTLLSRKDQISQQLDEPAVELSWAQAGLL